MNCSLENIMSPDRSRFNLLKGSNIVQTSLFIQNVQNKNKQREILQKCVHRIKKSTQVKGYLQLDKTQLSIINDKASPDVEIQQKQSTTHQDTIFEKLYYQTKHTSGRLRLVILDVLRKKPLRHAYTFQPTHPLIILWNLIKVCFMIHIFFVFPLIDAFQQRINTFLNQQQTLFLIEWIFLMVDLVIRFNLQIYQEGRLVTANREIAKLYFRSGFLVDVCGIVGFTLFLFDDRWFIRYAYFLKITEMKKFLKLLRRQIDPQNKSKNYVQLLTLLCTIFLLAHIIACSWIAIGLLNEDSWLVNKCLIDEGWFVQYTWAFYFSILTMTTVGYGDIVPVNFQETLACIAIVLLSSGIFAYTLNTITVVLKDIDADEQIYKDDARIIQNYMVKKNIGSDLQRRVKQYLRFLWKKGVNDKLNQELRVFHQLSPSLQQEINMQDKGRPLVNVPFLVNNFSLEFLKDLMSQVREIFFQPGENLPARDGLYILYKGKAEFVWPMHNGKLKKLGVMNSGEHYGLQNLFEIEEGNVQIRMQDFCIFYFIPREAFLETLKGADYEAYCMVRDQVVQGNYANMHMKCIVCRKDGHFPCQDVFYKPNLAMALARANRSQYQERVKWNRLPIKYQIQRNYQNLQIQTDKFIQENKVLTGKFKSPMDSFDEEQDLQNSSVCHSAESWRVNSPIVEERHNSVRQIRKVRRIEDHAVVQNSPGPSASVARKSIVVPATVVTFRAIYRKPTHEQTMSQFQLRNESHSPTMLQQLQTMAQSVQHQQFSPQQQAQIQQIQQQLQQQQQQSQLLNQMSMDQYIHDETQFDFQFDKMRLFSTYYQQDNYDAVLKQIRPRRRLKKIKALKD